MRGFRGYLRELPAGSLPPDLADADLSAFHYGEWLRGKGFDFRSNYANTPLFFEYCAFQERNIHRYFGELADYAREYARSVGREVLVSGNFFNLFEHYYAIEPAVDVIVTEMRNTLWRQPEWYRYAAGFARGKPLVVAENPYGGVVPELVGMLNDGRGYDRYRQSLYEAAALGVNMSVPYGAWMGSVVEDAFYAPHEVTAEVQAFLAEHEDLFGGDPTLAEVVVVYGVTSNARARSGVEVPADNRVNEIPEGDVLPFDRVSRILAAAAQPYDVVFFPDGELRADALTDADLSGYRTLIVPGLDVMTERQAQLLASFRDGGGRLVVLGDLGTNLGERAGAVVGGERVTVGGAFSFELGMLPGGPQLTVVEGRTDLAVTLQPAGDGAALRFVRYDYDESADRVPALPRLVVDVRLPFDAGRATAISPGGGLTATLEPRGGGVARLELRDVPICGIVLLERA
jgi:hypothetical protein